MNHDEQAAFGVGAFLAIAGMFVGAAIHVTFYGETDAGIRETQASAIEAGAAEWRIDPKTGEKQFTWLGAKSGR